MAVIGYSPISSSSFSTVGQKRVYRRNAYGDKRLGAGVEVLLGAMTAGQSSVVQRLPLGKNGVVSSYRLLRKKKVSLGELIHELTRVMTRLIIQPYS